ncbi:SHOCT domain-containing protein [Streptomyces sp. NPDC054784]
MNTLAHGADGPGPGPWLLLVPLFWTAVVVGVAAFARGAVARARGHRRGPGRASAAHAPLELLAHRFAAGEIDEDEYWLRLAVLRESRSGAA